MEIYTHGRGRNAAENIPGPQFGGEFKRTHSTLPELSTSVITNVVSDALLLLNEDFQLVYANHQLFNMIEREKDSLLGSKPGDIFGCLHAVASNRGCGSTEYCSDCGVRKILREALDTQKAEGECRILAVNHKAFNLHVRAERVPFGLQNYLIVAIKDIRHEKRRAALERTFFHDLLNTAGIVLTASKMLGSSSEPREKLLEMIQNNAEQLIAEIQSHRELVDAERGRLELNFEFIRPLELLHNLKSKFEYSRAAQGKFIRLDLDAESPLLKSDPVIIGRVLNNLLKNALEASSSEDTVTLACRSKNDGIQFSVHNPGYMGQDIQHQIFQRSFSTKGSDRGIGTYSIKLFVEEYLGGHVWFESHKDSGTTFYVRLPNR